MKTIFLSAVERAGLVSYLSRVVALDDRAAVRVQAGGAVAGVWSGPPFGVLALRPVSLLQPSDSDTTVAARRLLDALGVLDSSDSASAPDAAAGGPVVLPDSVLGPPWAAMLPPRSGWELIAEAPVGVIADQVAVMVEGFRRRSDLLAVGGRTAPALTAAAEELWAAPSLGEVPMRAAHAAATLGLLGREGTVTAWRCSSWSRLGCPGGSVLVRADAGAGGLARVDVLGAFGPG